MKKDYSNIKYYMTTLTNDEKRFYRENGLFVYDLRESCLYGDGGTIAHSVLVNNCGSIITDKDLGHIDTWDEIGLDDFMDSATCMEYDELQKLLGGKEFFHKVNAPIIGANGNVFNLIAICQRELKANGYNDIARNLPNIINNQAKNYDEALQIMMKYVEPVSSLDMDEMDL